MSTTDQIITRKEPDPAPADTNNTSQKPKREKRLFYTPTADHNTRIDPATQQNQHHFN
jgi:hypothetical protein